jgi:Fic family protein
MSWIWEDTNWTNFRWDREELRILLPAIYRQQGQLSGLARAQGNSDQSALNALLENIVQSSAIEGENLDRESVKSSLANKLGLVDDERGRSTDKSDGLVEMMLDAVTNVHEPLTEERLFKWHRQLFPENEFRIEPIDVGKYRTEGVMQVVSSRPSHMPVVHFQAPPVDRVNQEMVDFITWFNESAGDPSLDPIERAALAHFRFVTIHPFDDGNGRIGRAIGDLALGQADPESIRLYAMSAGIAKDRKGYYQALENAQKGGANLSGWVNWFARTLDKSLGLACERIDQTLTKTRFWEQHRETHLNPEQHKALNKLLDGKFPDGLSASKYAAFAQVSKATATRHLTDLVEKGCLKIFGGGGRSTRYAVRNQESMPIQPLSVDITHDAALKKRVLTELTALPSSRLAEIEQATRGRLKAIEDQPKPSRLELQEKRGLIAGLKLIDQVSQASMRSPDKPVSTIKQINAVKGGFRQR